jgi:Coenzyme PQQ synthesis protein D (PqqD)
MKEISSTSKICLCTDLQAMEVDDATVIANGRAGDCYGLELISRRIWQLLYRPTTVAELCEALLREYDVDRETCEREVLEFLNDSRVEGLVQTAD